MSEGITKYLSNISSYSRNQGFTLLRKFTVLVHSKREAIKEDVNEGKGEEKKIVRMRENNKGMERGLSKMLHTQVGTLLDKIHQKYLPK